MARIVSFIGLSPFVAVSGSCFATGIPLTSRMNFQKTPPTARIGRAPASQLATPWRYLIPVCTFLPSASA